MPRRATQPQLPHYLAITPRKLAILSTGTFGFYQIYWFYRQWKVYAQRTGRKVWLLPRALFAELISPPLFQEVADSAERRTGRRPFPPLAMAVVLLALAACQALPGIASLLSLLSVAPLLWVQEAMNAEPGAVASDRLTAGQRVMVTLGYALMAFIALGMLGTRYGW